MKNAFGQSVTLNIFGESHGPAIGAVLSGLAPGTKIDLDFISNCLEKRRPAGAISTPRRELDEFEILSGVKDGVATGTPITIMIRNNDTKSKDYEKTRFLARPGHADYTAFLKYHGFEDYRGGGHFSGRITAAIVAAGAICLHALMEKGIFIGTHILRCRDVSDVPFKNSKEEIKELANAEFPVINKDIKEKIENIILSARENNDSVGAVLQTAVSGLPEGIGEPYFDSVESVISHAMFSIPAVKGVEFGDGFSFADKFGSEANDGFCMKNGKITAITNHNGGINGGISNGADVLFQCAFKPTPSISRVQKTVNFMEKEDAEIEISGRHDPAVFHRAVPVINCITAIALSDLLAQRFGTDYLK